MLFGWMNGEVAQVEVPARDGASSIFARIKISNIAAVEDKIATTDSRRPYGSTTSKSSIAEL
jgi:hypothetical protein